MPLSRRLLVAVMLFGLAIACTTTQASPVSGDAKPAVACKLTPDQLAAKRQKLIPGLIDRAVEVKEVPNGLRLRFDSEPKLLRDLAKVMEQERDCCSFLRFELKTEPGAGPVTLEITGPPGTAEMLRNL